MTMRSLRILVLAAIALATACAGSSNPEEQFKVTTNEEGISVTDPSGAVRSVGWTDIRRVTVRTTDDGPLEPDVFWRIDGGPEPLLYPGGAVGETAAVSALIARLPGFNEPELIRAMGSTSNADFLLWRAPASAPPP